MKNYNRKRLLKVPEESSRKIIMSVDLLSEDLEQIKLTDCEFIFRENGKIKSVFAHKAVLVSVSSWFRRMFHDNELQMPVEMKDVSSKTFELMIDIIYENSDVVNDYKDACSLYYASKMYEVPQALKIARKCLQKDLSSSNAGEIYETVRLFGDHELIEKCRTILVPAVFSAPVQSLDLTVDPFCLLGQENSMLC